MMIRLSCPVLLILLLSQDAIAQNRSEFRAILVPVYDSGPGAYGAVWTSELRIYNDSEREANFASIVYFAPCQLGAPCPAPIPPKTVVSFGYAPNQIAGMVVYEPKDLSRNIHYHLRIRDEARQGSTSGTEIPLVSEEQFRGDEFFLLDVPTTRQSRQTLRLYSLSTNPPVVRVRFFSQREPDFINFRPRQQLLREVVVALERPPGSQMDDPVFPLRPSFARFTDLLVHFPEIAVEQKVMIAISTLTPGVPVWAFVSLTDNMTQYVTTITPSPSRPQ